MNYIKLNDTEALQATKPESFIVKRKLTWPVMSRDQDKSTHGFTCRMYCLEDLQFLREIVSVRQTDPALIVSPFGTVGDILWVKETYIVSTKVLKGGNRDTVTYKADLLGFRTAYRWWKAQAMPQRFSRSNVEIMHIAIEQKRPDLFNWVFSLKRRETC